MTTGKCAKGSRGLGAVLDRPTAVVGSPGRSHGEPDNIGRRNAVIEAVMRLGAVCIDPLLNHLKQKPEHRKVLVDVLGTFGDPRVIPTLGETLLDDDANVRIASMEQLASFTGEEVLPALRGALKSTDTLVVLAALDGLNRQRDKLSVVGLTPLLSEVTLRPALMTALGHTEDAAAIPALIEGLIEKPAALARRLWSVSIAYTSR